MPELKLYHLPGACSRVTLTALEHVGASYDDEVVNLMKGQQHSPEYRRVNPKGKIPALIVDGKLLEENAAILWWLHLTHPEAGLFPKAETSWDKAKQYGDLSQISANWHPNVRANMMPIRMTNGNPEEVRAKGKELVKPLFERFDALMQSQPWWYGKNWSILDVYAYWCYTTAEEGQFDLTGLSGIADHRARVEAHPAFQKALTREQQARERSAL